MPVALKAILHLLVDKISNSFHTEAELTQVHAQIDELGTEVLNDLVEDLETGVTGQAGKKLSRG